MTGRAARISTLPPRALDAAWVAFAAVNLVAMAHWPRAETIPFHLIWISLTLLYGFRVWRPAATSFVLLGVAASTAYLISFDAIRGIQLWGELFEVPLMSAMFLAMVWHARRRQDANEALGRQAQRLGLLVASQERFIHDASHELRTPVAIARGHLELLKLESSAPAEIDVALDELGRIERLVERLLLLARAGGEGSLAPTEIQLDSFLEDVFLRWSEIAPRRWRLGPLAHGTLLADPEALRIALDALLENAVKYTAPSDAIELSARGAGTMAVIAVADSGSGIPEEALPHVFERFARADPSRSRTQGGVGLGLAIVQAMVEAHQGSCSVESSSAGSTFTLRIPGFELAEAPLAAVSASRETDQVSAGDVSVASRGV